jgi:hypothetical protein
MNTLHPLQTEYVTGARQYVLGFEPANIPDLHRYLKTQPWSLDYHHQQISACADRLAEGFPGARAFGSYFHAFGAMHGKLAGTAAELFRAYEGLHAADLDRHKRPRVNERLADLVANAHGGNYPTIDDGATPVHEVHAVMALYAADLYGRYWPPMHNPLDPVTDLAAYLGGLGTMCYDVADIHARFAETLTSAYPVDPNIHHFYNSLARGYYDAADVAQELATANLNVNSHDAGRRMAPRVNEKWADVGHNQ